MIRLVVNADDLGLNERLDDGIFLAQEKGILTSASLLVTGPHAAHAVARAQQQNLSLGLHLCLSTSLPPAAPLDTVRSLAPTGVFRNQWGQVALAASLGQVSLHEVENEFRAQLRLARHLGAHIDHLDSHQHLHFLPGLQDIVCRLSREEKLPLRWMREWPRPFALRRPGAFAKTFLVSTLGFSSSAQPFKKLTALGLYDSGQLTTSRLVNLLQQLVSGDYEIFCHPGLTPDALSEDPTWKYGWAEELEALVNPETKNLIQHRNIQLTTYGKLFSE